MSNELQLVIGICAIVATLVWVYQALRTKGIPGANAELDKLLTDKNRLDRIESTLDAIRAQSPQHEQVIATSRAVILDTVKTVQTMYAEALKLGLVLPFNEDAAKLLERISKVTDTVTDQQPNVASTDGGNIIPGAAA